MVIKIPADLLVCVPPILKNYYSGTEIDRFFRNHVSCIQLNAYSKGDRIEDYLIQTNARHEASLIIFAKFIRPAADAGDIETGKIKAVLADCGLQYENGNITKIVSLDILGEIKGRGNAAVNAEIGRILQEIDKDTMSAVHRAVSMLEAAFKVYLEKKQISFNEKEEFTRLWNKVAGDLKIRPKDLTNNQNYQQIVSGLYSVIHGTRGLRNSESAAHGKSERKYQAIQIKPRHARLTIHAAGAIANYVLECLE